MDQAQLELQLKVWKDLAISKQVLMRTAAVALKLDPDCTQDDLRDALESAVKRLAEADVKIHSIQAEAKQQITALENKVAASAKAEATAKAMAAQLQTDKESTAQQMAIERASVAKEIQKLKETIAERDRALKAINTALSDTPENVLKKMNVLKKQKQDEADARRDVEAALNTLRTEKRKLDTQMTESLQNGSKLVTKFRELHEVAVKLQEQLKPLAADAKDVPDVPELDSDLLESVETGKTVVKDEKDKDSKSGKKKK